MKILPVFIASLAIIYGNSVCNAAPSLSRLRGKRGEDAEKVTQEKFLNNSLLPPPEDDQDAKILFFEDKKFENGNYHFEFTQSDLHRREEFGTFDHDPMINDRVLTVNGSYDFIRTDGRRQHVEYTADRNGFKPTVTVF